MSVDEILRVEGLAKSYETRPWLAQISRKPTTPTRRPALVDVSLGLARGRTLGIVGESGSGKSTLARCLMLLERPDAGHIEFQGHDLTKLRGAELRRLRRRIQMVFQDPYSSL